MITGTGIITAQAIITITTMTTMIMITMIMATLITTTAIMTMTIITPAPTATTTCAPRWST